ncbi:MAG: B12-binding domain-containing radical SAM protein [Firmicutes bacterium]|nr:B12-binding domain-containing radical SAM protein [Bacillota bacterium]
MKETTPCVFVFLNQVYGKISGADYQLDLAYLRTYLQKNGIPTMQYINNHLTSYESLLRSLLKYGAKSFLFYINEYNYYINRVLVNDLKKIDPHLVIYILGPVSKFIAEHLDDIQADVVIKEYGANALLQLLSGSDGLNSIPNISYRQANLIHHNQMSRAEVSLDELGLPYSSGMIPPELSPYVGIRSSMGCYGNCSFCSYKNAIESTFRPHSVESVIQELEYIEWYINGKNLTIHFLDDCFSLNQERTMTLCESILKKGLEFQFWCCTRADLLSREIIDLMSACNFKNIVIGLETASEKVFNTLGKKQVSDFELYLNELRAIYKTAWNKKINPYLSVLFGLPAEQIKDAKETIDFIKSLYPEVNISPCYLTCFPGSRLFDYSSENEIIKKSSPSLLPFWTFFDKYDIRIIKKSLDDLNFNVDTIYSSEVVVDNNLSYFTGIYGKKEPTGALKHLEINNLDDVTLEYVKNNLDFNGALIIHTEKLRLEEKSLFCEDRKRLKMNLLNYNENLKKLVSHNVFALNQLFYQKRGNVYLFQVNNDFQGHPITKEIYEDSEENVLSLLNKVKSGLTKGFFNLSEFPEWYLNQCGIAGKCFLGKLPRLNLTKKDPQLCVHRGSFIRSNDSSQLLLYIKQVFSGLDTQRDCRHCLAKDFCPKCAFPFSQNYCKIILENYCTIKYLKLITYLKRFPVNYLEVHLRDEADGLVFLMIEHQKFAFSYEQNELYPVK